MQSYLSLKLGDVNLANQQFSIAKAVYDDLQSSDKSSGVTQRDLLILETFNETYLDHAIKQETVDTLGISFEQLHKSDHLAKGIISACIALINNQLGQFEQAQTMAMISEQEMQLANCWVGLNYSQIHHAQSLAYRGKLLQAQQQFERASALAQQHLGIDNGLKSMISCLVAELHYLQHQPTQAQQLLEQEIAILEDKDCWHDIYAVCFKLAINLGIAQQNQAMARQYLERGRQVVQQRELSRLGDLLDILELKIVASFGDVSEFNALNSQIIRAPYWQNTSAMWQLFSEYYWVMSLNYLNRNVGNQCLSYASKLADLAQQTQQYAYAVRAHCVTALVHWQANKQSQALAEFNHAITLAAQHKIAVVFFEVPPLVEQLLTALKQQKKAHKLLPQRLDFINALLADLGHLQLNAFEQLGLSQREQQIAPYLAKGMTNKQIAQQLGISDNTVKFHLKNLFVKLKVHNRTEAMALLLED